MTATANQDQEIILYVPRSNILGVALTGTCLLIGGELFLFSQGGGSLSLVSVFSSSSQVQVS